MARSESHDGHCAKSEASEAHETLIDQDGQRYIPKESPQATRTFSDNGKDSGGTEREGFDRLAEGPGGPLELDGQSKKHIHFAKEEKPSLPRRATSIYRRKHRTHSTTRRDDEVTSGPHFTQPTYSAAQKKRDKVEREASDWGLGYSDGFDSGISSAASSRQNSLGSRPVTPSDSYTHRRTRQPRGHVESLGYMHEMSDMTEAGQSSQRKTATRISRPSESYLTVKHKDESDAHDGFSSKTEAVEGQTDSPKEPVDFILQDAQVVNVKPERASKNKDFDHASHLPVGLIQRKLGTEELETEVRKLARKLKTAQKKHRAAEKAFLMAQQERRASRLEHAELKRLTQSRIEENEALRQSIASLNQVVETSADASIAREAQVTHNFEQLLEDTEAVEHAMRANPRQIEAYESRFSASNDAPAILNKLCKHLRNTFGLYVYAIAEVQNKSSTIDQESWSKLYYQTSADLQALKAKYERLRSIAQDIKHHELANHELKYELRQTILERDDHKLRAAMWQDEHATLQSWCEVHKSEVQDTLTQLHHEFADHRSECEAQLPKNNPDWWIIKRLQDQVRSLEAQLEVRRLDNARLDDDRARAINEFKKLYQDHARGRDMLFAPPDYFIGDAKRRRVPRYESQVEMEARKAQVEKFKGLQCERRRRAKIEEETSDDEEEEALGDIMTNSLLSLSDIV